jgi:hypothetical protein
MTCPSCASRVALRDGSGPTLAWDLLIDAIERWADGGPDTLACPRCGASGCLGQWRMQPPWAFGTMMLTFWNWPPLSEEFIRRVSNRLGHRIVTIIGGI